MAGFAVDEAEAAAGAPPAPRKPSVWKRRYSFPPRGWPTVLAAALILEGGLCASLAIWAVVDVIARGRSAIDSGQVFPGISTLVFHFEWGRAAEFVMPLLFLALLFSCGGVSFLVATRREGLERPAARLLTVAACVAQPVLLVAAPLWLRLAPQRSLFTPEGLSFAPLPLPYFGIYPEAVLGVIEPLILLLAAGSLLALTLVLRRRIARGVGGGRIALAAAALVTVFSWLMVDSVNSQYSLQRPRYTPLPEAFWSATLEPSGAFSAGDGVSCTPGGPCTALAVGAITKFGPAGVVGAWATATLRHGRWTLGALLDASPRQGLLGGPQTLACLSADDCLALVNPAPSLRLPPELLTTSDGGERWSSVALPPGIVKQSTLRGVRCAAGHCFILGKTSLFESDDAGHTWYMSLSLPSAPASDATAVGGSASPVLASVGCSSKLDCIAVDDDAGAAVVYSSHDGGRSWTDHRPAGLASLSAVRCIESTCHALGTPSRRGGPPQSSVALFQTADNGATWTDLGPLPDYLFVSDLACPETGECIVVGNNPFSGQALVMVTRNSGATWQQGSGVSGSALTLTSLDCSSPSLCVLTGSDAGGAVLGVSTDAGMRWVVQPFPAIRS